MPKRGIHSIVTLLLLCLLPGIALADGPVRMGSLIPDSDVAGSRILFLDVSEPVPAAPPRNRMYAPLVHQPDYTSRPPGDDVPVLFLDKTHEEAEKDLVTDFMRDTALGILGNTRLGREADRLADRVASYFRLEFTKKRLSDDLMWVLPGQEQTDTENPLDILYGLSFSTRFRLNTSDLVEDVILECRSNFFRNNARLSWEIMDDQLRLDFFNTNLNRYIGADIHVELTGGPEGASGALLFKKLF